MFETRGGYDKGTNQNKDIITRKFGPEIASGNDKKQKQEC